MSDGNFYDKLQDGYTIATARKEENVWKPEAKEEKETPEFSEAGAGIVEATEETKVKKEKKSGKKIFLLATSFLLIAIVVAGTIFGVKKFVEKKAYEKLVAEYDELVKQGRDELRSGDYEEAISLFNQALEVDCYEYEDAYRYMGQTYIRMAGENYSDSNSYLDMGNTDEAIGCCKNAEEYLKKADKYWNGEGFRFSDVAFYDCKSINDAQLLVATRKKKIEERQGYTLLAIEVLTKAETLLSDCDYVLMNELDTSDESDMVYQYLVDNAYTDHVILYRDDEGDKITTESYDGYGVAIYDTYSGFYYYKGEIISGAPNGEGVGYISNSSGQYKVIIGGWKDGDPYGDMDMLCFDGIYMEECKGYAGRYGFDGKIAFERTDVLTGETVHCIIKYDDGEAHYLDGVDCNDFIRNYKKDSDTDKDKDDNKDTEEDFDIEDLRARIESDFEEYLYIGFLLDEDESYVGMLYRDSILRLDFYF